MAPMVHWRGHKFNDFNGDGICRRDSVFLEIPCVSDELQAPCRLWPDNALLVMTGEQWMMKMIEGL